MRWVTTAPSVGVRARERTLGDRAEHCMQGVPGATALQAHSVHMVQVRKTTAFLKTNLKA